MTSADLRDQVLRLRRSGTLAPALAGAAVLAGLVLALVYGEPTWPVWLVFLGLGTWMWTSVTRSARRRDAVVLRCDNAAVRNYLGGRLDRTRTRIARNELALGILSLPILLLASVYLTESGRYPVRPGLGVPLALLGGALLVTFVVRRFVVRPALQRQLAALGDLPAPRPDDPWIVVCVRAIAAEQDDLQAALLWYEVTGGKYRDARATVNGILGAVAATSRTPASAAGPPPEAVRSLVRRLGRGDLYAAGLTLVLLATLVEAENWAHRVPWSVFLREPWGDLTIAQQIYVAVAMLVVVGAFVQAGFHRTALRGDDASVRAYLRRQLERRLARLARWSPLQIGLAVLAVLLAARAAVVTVLDSSQGWPDRGLAQLVEAGVLCVWLIAWPLDARRRYRPFLERALAEQTGTPAPGVSPPGA